MPAKSTHSRRASKPAKPFPTFSLYAHASGRWARKIAGKTHFFGRWGNKQGNRIVPVEDIEDSAREAQKEHDRQWPYLSAGNSPPPVDVGGCMLRVVINAYLNEKRRRMEAGEIARRTFGEYYATCKRVIEAFGAERAIDTLTPEDFGTLRAKLAKTRGPVTLGNEIQRVRMIFRFADENGLIDKPVRFGRSLDKPSKRVVRKAKAASGSRMFEATELLRILEALQDKPTLRAMTLLAINAAFGQHDVACLPVAALDLDGGYVTFPRPKTGVERRAKLWKETVDALESVLSHRPEALTAEDAGLVFLTSKGKRWIRGSHSDNPADWTNRTDLIGNEFAKVLRKLDIDGRRGFYAIRHSHQTAAEGCRDFPAVMHVMGHTDASMSGAYRERINDSRLVAVADTVHAWLFGEGGAA